MAADESETERAERVVLWQRASAPVERSVGEDEPDAEDPAAAALDTEKRWTEQVLSRVRASGAEVLVDVGATVVAALDSVELQDAIELARSLVADAKAGAGRLQVDIGVAVGEVEQTTAAGKPTTYRGGAIDRAQALANAGGGNEVVLDDAAVTTASEHYLFGREVLTHGAHGRALDPHSARKEDCRKALARLLSPPLPKSMAEALAQLRELANAAEPQTRIVLRCTTAAAPLELAERLAQQLAPPLYLRVSRKAGGLQPLGGLALALRRAWPDDAAWEASSLPPALRAMLKTLLRGQGVSRADMVEALTALLRVRAQAGGRPFVVLDQLHEIDPASLGVVAEALLDLDVSCVLVMTLPAEGSVPAALVPKGDLHELVLPPLSEHEAEKLAAAVLSVPERSHVAERVAAIGGDSAFGVIEAARTLVSAGDLIPAGDAGFEFRSAPRGGSEPLPIEALITERALGLPPNTYRVLEVLCLAPPDASRELIANVIAHDGLREEDLDQGLLQLTAEGFVQRGMSLGNADATVRNAIRGSMPPARAAELHRFIAEQLATRQKAPGFGSAQVAYHLAEGGQEADAARALIEAARAAAQASFQRVALRLLATAVELDGSPELQALASEVAETIDLPAVAAAQNAPAKPDDAAAAAGSDSATIAMEAVRKALVQRDYDAAERWLDGAIAAGWGRSAAQRMLAMTQLARGDTGDATLTMARSIAPQPADEVQARDALGWALVQLESGEPALGVRSALSALAKSKRIADGKGRAAALLVLASCYRALGRDDDAKKLHEASGAA